MIATRAGAICVQAQSKPGPERSRVATLVGPAALEPVGATEDAMKAKAGCV